MKTALIIVSVVGGLLLIAAILLLISNSKMKKTLKDPKAMWDKMVATFPTYATNADALEAGLKVGDWYKTASGEPKQVTAATTA